MAQPSVSLIISKYNWPAALRLVLMSVKNQTTLPDEVIISDDGSGEETEALIRDIREDFPVPKLHVWHEDEGFRLAVIRNKAIIQATCKYIIQTDGDALLHRRFIEDHIRAAEKGTFLSGSRVWLNEKTSQKALTDNRFAFYWWSSGIKNRWNAFYNRVLSSINTRKVTKAREAAYNVRGCNMSFWKSDLMLVNGYDEKMTGWGREDSELAARLVHAGVVLKKIKSCAIQYHLYHEIETRSGLNLNDEILKNTIKTKKIRCEQGISNYL